MSYNVTDMSRGRVYFIDKANSASNGERVFLTEDGYTVDSIKKAPYMGVTGAIKAIQNYSSTIDGQVYNVLYLSNVYMTDFWEEDLFTNYPKNTDNLESYSLSVILESKINHIPYVSYYHDGNINDVDRKLYLARDTATGYSTSSIERAYRHLIHILDRELIRNRSDITKLYVYPLGIDRLPHNILYVINQWLHEDKGTGNIYLK